MVVYEGYNQLPEKVAAVKIWRKLLHIIVMFGSIVFKKKNSMLPLGMASNKIRLILNEKNKF